MADLVELASLLIPWAFYLALMFTIVLADEDQLAPPEQDRAWPVATRAAALVYFGAFALPVHFWRTRRSAYGLVLGLAWGGLALGLYTGLAMGVDLLVHGNTSSE